MKKIILMLLIIPFLVMLMSTNLEVKASDGMLSDVLSQGKDFLSKGEDESILTMDIEELKELSDDIYGVLFYIGVIVAVLIGAVIGIKIMLASAEDKAKVKEALIPYVIGCFVIFGAFGIWKITINIFSILE